MRQHPLRGEAIVAVLRRGGRLLVIKRAAGVILPGYWTPPSGTIEPGETHEEALVREVEEELGVKATPVAKVWECRARVGHALGTRCRSLLPPSPTTEVTSRHR